MTTRTIDMAQAAAAAAGGGAQLMQFLFDELTDAADRL